MKTIGVCLGTSLIADLRPLAEVRKFGSDLLAQLCAGKDLVVKIKPARVSIDEILGLREAQVQTLQDVCMQAVHLNSRPAVVMISA